MKMACVTHDGAGEKTSRHLSESVSTAAFAFVSVAKAIGTCVCVYISIPPTSFICL